MFLSLFLCFFLSFFVCLLACLPTPPYVIVSLFLTKPQVSECSLYCIVLYCTVLCYTVPFPNDPYVPYPRSDMHHGNDACLLCLPALPAPHPPKKPKSIKTCSPLTLHSNFSQSVTCILFSTLPSTFQSTLPFNVPSNSSFHSILLHPPNSLVVCYLQQVYLHPLTYHELHSPNNSF